MKMDREAYLCLTDLLDQDLSAYEYFQTLSPEVQKKLLTQDITTFQQLQSAVSGAQT